MRVLVTGASGFVGRHLVARLARERGTFRLAVRSNDAATRLARVIGAPEPPSRFEVVVVGDIDGYTEWRTALHGMDSVVHLAGHAHRSHDDPVEAAVHVRVNTEGTRNLAMQAAAAGVEHLVFVSSIGAITSSSERPVHELTTPKPHTPYGQSKLAAELALRDVAGPMAYTIVRPPLVYGAGNPGNMQRVIKLVRSGVPLPLGGVRNRRSMIYAGNLADALVRCLKVPAARNQTFVVSDGRPLSTPELIGTIARAAGLRCRLLPIPVWGLRVLGCAGDALTLLLRRRLPVSTDAIERLVGSLVVDPSKIRRDLGWHPPYTVDYGFAQAVVAQDRPPRIAGERADDSDLARGATRVRTWSRPNS